MPQALKTMITLLGGESLDLTVAPFAGMNVCVGLVHPDGLACKFSARTMLNTTGEKRDRSTTGIFVAADATKALSALSIVHGPFDKVYCATGSDPIRCEIMEGAGL